MCEVLKEWVKISYEEGEWGGRGGGGAAAGVAAVWIQQVHVLVVKLNDLILITETYIINYEFCLSKILCEYKVCIYKQYIHNTHMYGVYVI